MGWGRWSLKLRLGRAMLGLRVLTVTGTLETLALGGWMVLGRGVVNTVTRLLRLVLLRLNLLLLDTLLLLLWLWLWLLLRVELLL